MEVVWLGKLVGKFPGFTDDMKYVKVITFNSTQRVFLASECSVRCDRERRHNGLRIVGFR